MSSPPPDPTPGKPPCEADPLEKTRWFKDEVHVHDAKLKSYLRGSFPTIDVEDVVQESYLRTWLAHAVSPIRSAKAFLFTVARCLAIDSRRNQQKSPIVAVSNLALLDVIDESTDTVEAASVNDELTLLAEAVNSLPPRCREIIILRAFQNIPRREVALRLSIDETTVATQACIGMRRLEAFFTKHGAIEPWRNIRPGQTHNSKTHSPKTPNPKTPNPKTPSSKTSSPKTHNSKAHSSKAHNSKTHNSKSHRSKIPNSKIQKSTQRGAA